MIENWHPINLNSITLCVSGLLNFFLKEFNKLASNQSNSWFAKQALGSINENSAKMYLLSCQFLLRRNCNFKTDMIKITHCWYHSSTAFMFNVKIMGTFSSQQHDFIFRHGFQFRCNRDCYSACSYCVVHKRYNVINL